MKQALAALTLAAALAGMAATPSALASGETAKSHIVMQVSEGDPAVWNLALNNAENVQQALGKDKVTVEIVAYGPGLKMLTSDSKVSSRVNGALDRNVKLIACGTTMRKMKVTEASGAQAPAMPIGSLRPRSLLRHDAPASPSCPSGWRRGYA